MKKYRISVTKESDTTYVIRLFNVAEKPIFELVSDKYLSTNKVIKIYNQQKPYLLA